jgi:hypothetical protein
MDFWGVKSVFTLSLLDFRGGGGGVDEWDVGVRSKLVRFSLISLPFAHRANGSLSFVRRSLSFFHLFTNKKKTESYLFANGLNVCPCVYIYTR